MMCALTLGGTQEKTTRMWECVCDSLHDIPLK